MKTPKELDEIYEMTHKRHPNFFNALCEEIVNQYDYEKKESTIDMVVVGITLRTKYPVPDWNDIRNRVTVKTLHDPSFKWITKYMIAILKRFGWGINAVVNSNRYITFVPRSGINENPSDWWEGV